MTGKENPKRENRQALAAEGARRGGVVAANAIGHRRGTILATARTPLPSPRARPPAGPDGARQTSRKEKCRQKSGYRQQPGSRDYPSPSTFSGRLPERQIALQAS